MEHIACPSAHAPFCAQLGAQNAPEEEEDSSAPFPDSWSCFNRHHEGPRSRRSAVSPLPKGSDCSL